MKVEDEEYNDEDEINGDLHLIVSSQLNEHLKDTIGAMQTIDLMPEGSYYKDWALSHLGFLHTQVGEEDAASISFQHARRSISSIRKPVQKVFSLGALACTMAGAGKQHEANILIQEAEQIAMRLDQGEQAWAWLKLGKAQLSCGDPKATFTLRRIAHIDKNLPEKGARFIRAIQLVSAQSKFGDAKGAIETANMFTDSSDKDERARKSWLLEIIACRQVSHSGVEEAAKTARTIQNDDNRDEALFCIVERLSRDGKVKSAFQTMTAMLSPRAKARAYDVIARAQAEQGHLDAASQTVDRATKLALQVNHEGAQGVALKEIVKTLVILGRMPDALKLMESIKGGWARINALEILANAFIKKGSREKALSLFKQAEQLDPEWQVAHIYARLGDVRKGLEIAKTLGERQRATALLFIAREQSKNGSAREALSWSKEVRPTKTKISALIGIAQGMLSRYDH